MKKILTIANQKGGVAKSTTCAQVGGYVASQGKRVLLVDLDPQGNASSKFLRMKQNYDAGSNAINPPAHPDGNTYTARALFFEDAEWDGYPTATENLHVLPASSAMYEMQQYPKEAINNLLDWMNNPAVWETYDLIIFDTPPAKNLYSEAALTAATHILIPCPMEKAPYEGLMAVIQFINVVNSPLHQDEVAETIGILPTMYRATTSIHKQFLTRLNKLLGAHATPFQIRYRPTYQEIDMVARYEAYVIKPNSKTKAAFEEWQALGEYVINRMELR